MKNQLEKSIWLSFTQGDVASFSLLFKNFYAELHHYGLKISGNSALTEDCIQSFFVYLFEHRENMGDVQNVKSYLFVSFRRSLFNHLKKERKYTTYETVFENSNDFSFSPEELLINQEFKNTKTTILTQLLNQLSTRQREVIYLKYYSDLQIEEISEIMNISYQSVLNTLQKSFVNLRKATENQQLEQVLKII